MKIENWKLKVELKIDLSQIIHFSLFIISVFHFQFSAFSSHRFQLSVFSFQLSTLTAFPVLDTQHIYTLSGRINIRNQNTFFTKSHSAVFSQIQANVSISDEDRESPVRNVISLFFYLFYYRFHKDLKHGCLPSNNLFRYDFLPCCETGR